MDAIPQTATAAAVLSSADNSNAVNPSGRKLARIVRITAIEQIPNADKVDLYSVLGWKVVGQKNQFKVGDLCIYFEIDSILSNDAGVPWAFLEGKPLKTKKLRGVLSQGLLGPLNWLPVDFDRSQIQEGFDVTSVLKVQKHVSDDEVRVYKPSSHHGAASARGPFPEFVPKTDEERVQNLVPGTLESLIGRQCVITRKLDGTSTTCVWNGTFMLCSRNNTLLSRGPDTAEFFDIAEKHKLADGLQKLDRNIAIQGEMCGPKINGGRTKVPSNTFSVFNIYDIDNRVYLNWTDVKRICAVLGLDTVPYFLIPYFPDKLASVQALLDIANKEEYAPGVPAEGIVLKTNDDLGERFSCKIISNTYLLKNNN